MLGFSIIILFSGTLFAQQQLPLFWWRPISCEPNQLRTNFGDELSKLVVEKILNKKIVRAKKDQHKLLAIGSILHFARDGDIVWGSGINGKIREASHTFSRLDVRAVRGPITREFLLSRGVVCPQIFGDPALLLPLLYPELQRNPIRPFIVIPHLHEINYLKDYPNVILPTKDPLDIICNILEAKLVISSSLHGIIVAEAFGIPAQLLRVTDKEPLTKYIDYYLGTNRTHFRIAKSLDEAITFGGEPLPQINLQQLLDSFPYDAF